MRYATHVTRDGQKVLNISLWGEDEYMREHFEDFLDEVKEVLKDMLDKESTE